METYVLFLLISVVLVLADGQLIYRNGREYLERAYGKTSTARSMTQLVTVLFHLVVLGLLALVSTVQVEAGDPARTLVLHVGVVLLLLAAAHGATIAILARIRGRQREEELADNIDAGRRPQRRPSAMDPPPGGPTAPADMPADGSRPPGW